MLLSLVMIGCARTGGCGDTVSDALTDTSPDTTDTDTATDGTTDTAPIQTDVIVLRNATLAGEGPMSGTVADVRFEDGIITEIGAVSLDGAEVVDLKGRWLSPAFIDSHVHLAYREDGPGMLDGGVAVAVDLAAPMAFFAEDLSPLTLLLAGPMVTAVGGYPTQSWGSNGYGVECADEDDAVAAVSLLHKAGAAVIKLPITGSAVLTEDALTAAASAAHDLGLKVASHAMSDDDVALAVSVGVDVLAHTPTGSLSDATVASLSDRAVIPTLAAFGGSTTAVDNLRRLHEAGTTVLYGTDFGNITTAGIISGELMLMAEAGMSGAEILAAGTSVPADWWGLSDMGRIDIGSPASLLVLTADPTIEPLTLAQPEAVWIAGVER
ncbi:MAG: imidazolonepropionase-like amidohydrolase [Myxococcota bacterium]|jgi:imidazolonepropionase-like amidohydrolase